MTERPILFSGPMVRAILDGRKTVTRRVVKGAAAKWLIDFTPEFVADRANDLCPYGMPGDRLWVRETWMDLRGTGVEHRPTPDSPLQRYAYGADSPPGSASDEARKDFGLKWRPSIHMPRAASRLLLEITAVRVERLQDISEKQALAEGISPLSSGRFHCGHDEEGQITSKSPVTAFAWLWNGINGEGSWAENPWVWVVEFKRVTP
jgi:hypothetical protein